MSLLLATEEKKDPSDYLPRLSHNPLDDSLLHNPCGLSVFTFMHLTFTMSLCPINAAIMEVMRAQQLLQRAGVIVTQSRTALRLPTSLFKERTVFRVLKKMKTSLFYFILRLNTFLFSIFV